MTGKKVLEEILNLLKVFKLSCTIQAFCLVSEEILQAITRLNIYIQEQKYLQAWIPFVQVGICIQSWTIKKSGCLRTSSKI